MIKTNMCSTEAIARYLSNTNFKMRIDSLIAFGHDSSVWGPCIDIQSPTQSHMIEILSPEYVSSRCWGKVTEKANHITSVTLPFPKLMEATHDFVAYEDEVENKLVHQFYFYSENTAKEIALIVQKSARNVRKNKTRNASLKEAGGFYNKDVIEEIFAIQNGRCYYSGSRLVKQPKNYVIDHIHPICQGGTNWPGNLALVIKEINTLKGGHLSSTETLLQLSKSLGDDWLKMQKKYCLAVDLKRTLLDVEFRNNHENNSFELYPLLFK